MWLWSIPVAAVIAALLLVASPAVAVPAPKSPEQLLVDSDLVALVRVRSVTCTAMWRDERTGQTLHGYSAELEVLEAKKGAEVGDVVRVHFKEIPRGLVGAWSVSYYPGQEVWTHLQRDDGGDAYQSTWWNALGEEVRPPDILDLPQRLDQTVKAP